MNEDILYEHYSGDFAGAEKFARAMADIHNAEYHLGEVGEAAYQAGVTNSLVNEERTGMNLGCGELLMNTFHGINPEYKTNPEKEVDIIDAFKVLAYWHILSYSLRTFDTWGEAIAVGSLQIDDTLLTNHFCAIDKGSFDQKHGELNEIFTHFMSAPPDRADGELCDLHKVVKLLIEKGPESLKRVILSCQQQPDRLEM